MRLRPRKHSRRTRRLRVERGIYLIEILVSLMIGTLVAFTFLDLYNRSFHTSNKSTKESCANEILESLSEHTRAYGYARLSTLIGEHQLLLNKTEVGQLGPEVDERPIFLDLVDKKWISNPEHSFAGLIKYDVATGSGPSALTVTISISWADPDSQGGTRTIYRTIPIFDRGIPASL